MARVGFIVNGEKYNVHEVVSEAYRKGELAGFPPSAWQAMVLQTERRNWWCLSPSQATSCPRRYVLQITEDYYVDPVKLWPMLVGTAVHSVLEDSGDWSSALELRLTVSVVVDGQTKVYPFPLHGTCDNYDSSLRRLYDYKSTNDFRYYSPSKKRWIVKKFPEESHITQVNLYRLLLEHYDMKVDEAFLWYFKVTKDARRRLVEVPLWDLAETYQTAVDLATPLVLAKEEGILPECICEYKSTLFDRDLCSSIEDSEWKKIAA